MQTQQDLDNEWEQYMAIGDNYDSMPPPTESNASQYEFVSGQMYENMEEKHNPDAPVPNDIHISTKTIISYLNKPIDIDTLFWEIPVIPFHKQTTGIIKKQIKLRLYSQEEVDHVVQKVESTPHAKMQVLSTTTDPREPFNDKRKISVGISQKDIVDYNKRERGAFLNCFVIVYRLQNENGAPFSEAHVKVFNTGKVETPGIQSDAMLERVLQLVVKLLEPYIPGIRFTDAPPNIVLINSNFKCGYFIDRDILNDVLKYKYNIHTIYNPWYPGVQGKFYYDSNLKVQTGCPIPGIVSQSLEKGGGSKKNKCPLPKNITRVSFMIFRTGSVLIVGKCCEKIIHSIYDFLTILMNHEYSTIKQVYRLAELEPKPEPVVSAIVKKKLRKRLIWLDPKTTESYISEYTLAELEQREKEWKDKKANKK